MPEDEGNTPDKKPDKKPKEETTVVYGVEGKKAKAKESPSDTTVIFRPGETAVPNSPEMTIRSRLLGGAGSPSDSVFFRLPVENMASEGHGIVMQDDGKFLETEDRKSPDFEIIQKLNQGGMGVIFSARQLSLQRILAIKIWRTKKPVENEAERLKKMAEFTKEAFMTASLDHPNIVPIYELARDRNDRPFFTMKKVTGVCWKDLLHSDYIEDLGLRQRADAQAKRMSWRDHLEILLKVCDATAYAHSKSIIHRDIKPQNIMLGEFGEVYLMDWGLGMYIDERSDYRKNPSLAPELAGTPCYMAPEMARREVERFCPATDVYLLGGILYEFLTGEPPHRGANVDEVVQNAARGNVSPPEWVTDSTLVNPAISSIVMKALAPDIKDRYPNVQAFQRDLRNYLAHAESLTLSTRAAVLLDYLKKELVESPSDFVPELTSMDKDGAGIAYSRLWDCINTYRQSINLWDENSEARQGLLVALTLQVKLALEQGDLTMAESQFRYLEELQVSGSYDAFSNRVQSIIQELGAQLADKRKLAASQVKNAKMMKRAVSALIALLIVGVAVSLFMVDQQRKIAVENQKALFAGGVQSRAELVERYISGIESVVALYRERAVELMRKPMRELRDIPLNNAGRPGVYYDEDFYNPKARPPEMQFHAWYGNILSFDYPTIVFAPWARSGETKEAAEKDALRLGQLGPLFSKMHRANDDIKWSLAGTPNGTLIGFPGSGRYGDKPDYDPTKRPWYQAAIEEDSDNPVWGNPYSDASTKRLIISLMSRINVDGRNVGVVGLELPVEMFQQILVDYSLLPGKNIRSLLIKPVIEMESEKDEPRVVYRVIVDSEYKLKTDDWREKVPMISVEDLKEDLRGYIHRIVNGEVEASKTLVEGGKMYTFSRLKNHNWFLVVCADLED